MSTQLASPTKTRLRSAEPADAESCGRICYEAFHSISSRHAFPCDFPCAEVATELMRAMISHPGYYGVVAEFDGRIAGSNFLDERSTIAGLGPITIDPGVQNRGIGRALMTAVLERAESRAVPGVRLLQAGYHARSLSLYATLGFRPRSAHACMQGPAVRAEIPGHRVRKATESDLEACNSVCGSVHGHDRAGELRDAVDAGTALVVEHDGRITGYASHLAFFGHAVAETSRDLMALIGSEVPFAGPGILVPLDDFALFRWCLGRGLKVVQLLNLMSFGLYAEPNGAYLPSVMY